MKGAYVILYWKVWIESAGVKACSLQYNICRIETFYELYILNSLVGCVRNFQSSIVLLFKSLDLMDGRTIKKKIWYENYDTPLA